MKNPNEYSDENYKRGMAELEKAIGVLWDAGASVDDIEEILNNALQNVTSYAILVDVDADGRFAAA